MADFFPSVLRDFDAGHFVAGDPDCGHDGHGHRWRIKVTLKGAYEARTGYSANLNELGAALDAIIAELVGKSLNAMMPAGQPTPEGLGLWIIERLIPAFPKITKVKVWRDPFTSYSIKRDPR